MPKNDNKPTFNPKPKKPTKGGGPINTRGPLNTKGHKLSDDTSDAADQFMTTNHGLPLNDDQNSLKAGERGPSLLEDFHFREKMTHFDHERIPERIVHARGAGAHGVFKVYKSMAKYTRARFLNDPSLETPVFVRFSTVAGSRGSTDLARDARGFATKFYTEEGNFDLVGNNIPVFFIQDAMKFPDLVHAVKPEPHHEMPQAASAHDTFWDFISLMPESMHMIMWVMSDRAIPRSYRTMEGFGVHTFRLVNDKGVSRFVKFHWKPALGVHSVAWDEAQKISGFDADFHRRDLWEAIEAGNYPEYELGIQVVEEKDEDKFDFDLLDPTKIIPEELIPVERIGKLTLNRNPDNFFAETEQIAFHPGHVVPGIDFSNDPLLQGRLFSYTDTQLSRLGGPNFHEIPINRSVAPAHNNQRDGIKRHEINRGRVNYSPNSLGGGCPFQAKASQGGFTSFPQSMTGDKVRARGPKFFEHFSQARLFYISQSEFEKNHIINALRFELGKVDVKPIKERMLGLLAQVDTGLAQAVAAGLGIKVPSKLDSPMNHSVSADGDVSAHQPKPISKQPKPSPALSMANSVESPATRKVAVLAADGFDGAALPALKKIFEANKITPVLIAPHGGELKGAKGVVTEVDMTLLTTHSVLFDAVVVLGGAASVKALAKNERARDFVKDSYRHCKAILTIGEGNLLLDQLPIPEDFEDTALIRADSGNIAKAAANFVDALAKHRNWEREKQLEMEGPPSEATHLKRTFHDRSRRPGWRCGLA